MPVVILIVVIIALVVIVNCVKIVPQAHAVVVERLGGYLTTWSVGLHFKVPFIDRIAKRVLLKEQVVDFPPQPVITKDNVTMQIDTVVFFQITEKYNRINLHRNVIFRDNRLRRKIYNLLF